MRHYRTITAPPSISTPARAPPLSPLQFPPLLPLSLASNCSQSLTGVEDLRHGLCLVAGEPVSPCRPILVSSIRLFLAHLRVQTLSFLPPQNDVADDPNSRRSFFESPSAPRRRTGDLRTTPTCSSPSPCRPERRRHLLAVRTSPELRRRRHPEPAPTTASSIAVSTR